MANTFRFKALGWEAHLQDKVADEFFETCLSLESKDLSSVLLIVPTAEAGRLIREKIAEKFTHIGGIFSLNVKTPAYLMTPPFPCADEATVSANWLNLLKNINPEKYPLLLKGFEKYQNNLSWVIGIAGKIQQCRSDLAAEGLSVADVRFAFEKLSREKGAEEYWNRSFQFAELENLEREYLNGFEGGMREPVEAQLATISNPVLPKGTERVIIAGCPDPLPGAMFAASVLAERGTTVEIWVGAPEDAMIYFDAFGRPIANYWENQTLDFNLRQNVRRMRKPDDIADKLLESYSQNTLKPSVIGVLGEEISASIFEKISRMKNPPEFYIPRQVPLNALPFTKTYLKLLELSAENPSFELIASLARDPFVFNYGIREKGFENWTGSLTLLDKMQNEHILNDFSELEKALSHKKHPEFNALKTFCSLISKWNKILYESNDPLADCHAIFAEIATVCTDLLQDKPLAVTELQSMGTLIASIRKIKDTGNDFQRLIFHNLAKKTMVILNAENDAVTDIAGFLELPWRTDDDLIIAGFNEEYFNYGGLADMFLPDHARTLLLMRDQKFYYGVDVYRMKTLIETRRKKGSLYIILGSSSMSGDVLKPSRMLMQCQREELPERATLLFSDALVEENIDAAANKPKILYMPRIKYPVPEMSVTGFKAYIACPFRFYFDRILGAGELDDRNMELDNMQFGTIMHEVLQHFGESRYKNSTDPKQIADFCIKILHSILARQLDHARCGIPKLQSEIMETNLEYFAEIQAENASEGWEISFIEKDFNFQWNELFMKIFPDTPQEKWRNGINIKGKLDRLDFNPQKNIWRLIDYKTNKSDKSPNTEHFGKRGEEWRIAGFNKNGRPEYWKDLQLPLYILAVKNGFIKEVKLQSNTILSASYFNLPLTYTSTRIADFHELNRTSLLSSAALCADNILHNIFVKHLFWPPKKPEYEKYDDLTGYIGSYTGADFEPAFNESFKGVNL